MRRAYLYGVVAMLLLGFAASAYARPPRHAPAYGYRRHQRTRVVRTVYRPGPFVYLGTTYVPLRTATSLVGAALLWNSLDGRALVTFDGRELGLVIGSPNVLIGGETVVLSEPPIIVDEVVYVPADFCEHYLRVPVRHRGRIIELEGHEGWRQYQVASRPPGRVVRRMHGVTVERSRPEPRLSHGRVSIARPRMHTMRIEPRPARRQDRVVVERARPQRTRERIARPSGHGGGKAERARSREKGGGGGKGHGGGRGGGHGRD
jgi:hypothetical protein